MRSFTLFISLLLTTPFIGLGQNLSQPSVTGNPFSKKLKDPSQQVARQIDPISIDYRFRAQQSLPAASPYPTLLRPKPSAAPAGNGQIRIDRMDIDQKTGQVYFAEFKSDQPYFGASRADMSTKALQTLEKMSGLLRVENAQQAFILKHHEEDELGMHHFRFDQQHLGVPVYASEITLHFRPEGEIIFTGRSLPTPKSKHAQPKIELESAAKTALADLAEKTVSRPFTPAETAFFSYERAVGELVWYRPKGSEETYLTWHLTLRPNVIERWEYFVDARTGKLLHAFNHTCSVGPATASGSDLNGINRTINTFQAQNGTYYMIDASRNMYTGPTNQLPGAGTGVIITLDFNNTTTQNPQYNEITSGNNSWTPKAISAHYNAGESYVYFETVHSRNSINGSGGDVVSFINVADDNGLGLDNAFWNGSYMFYGNGASDFFPLAGALDVAGHEMSHGVIQETANLEYQDESGALNESFADVFGVMIDRDDWQLGEDVVRPNAFPSGALRDLSDPHNGGSVLGDPGWQPRHYNERYTGNQDNGGVHINSGIPNYAFYLFASNVGKDKAEKVYYRALNQYLTRSSQFVDCRNAVIQACNDLYSSTEANAAASAFDQVGIGGGTGGGNNGSNYQVDLQVNPGQDFIIFSDLLPNDPNKLYAMTPDGQNFIPLSTTDQKRPVSVTDNGGYVLFVDLNGNIRVIDLTGQSPQENALTSDNFWDNVAISKDGNRMAAISVNVEPKIYVYDFVSQQWGEFTLYNPTTGQGVSTGDVNYADAIEWDYSGEYLLYDAYNTINSNSGLPINYWDVGFIRVWNNQNNNFGDGQITKLFSGLQEGESVGNGVYSKNSPYIIAFDYLNSTTQEVAVLAANIETGEVGTVFQNSVIGYPNYSKLDNEMIFDAKDNQSNDVLAKVALLNNKIQAGGNASIFIPDAKWGVWFATGNRPLLSIDEDLTALEVEVYPNPAREFLDLQLEIEKPGTLTVEIVDLTGRVLSKTSENVVPGLFRERMVIENLSRGTYIIRLTKGHERGFKRFIKQ